jgi:hypothetical protein
MERRVFEERQAMIDDDIVYKRKKSFKVVLLKLPAKAVKQKLSKARYTPEPTRQLFPI